MEPGDRAAEAVNPSQRLTFRVRLVAACAVLVGLAMTQDPGFLVPDTKFDLVLDPAGFLGRSTHLWDAEGAFGQLQNQAYGYLWPMGPFFLLGSLLDVPGWVIQRLWVALVMCVAFLGTARVARALGVRSDLACIVAGFAFALSPRMLTTLGPISIEAWPSAVAPWVLLPLVHGAARGSARRAAALSALAVGMVGGVNAAAAAAVLPLGALWLLTLTPGPRRRTMMLWWPAFTALATLWWLVPLAIMGAYSPPFLDYIEAARNTTFPTTPFDSLRGTSNWVPYVSADSRAGNDLLRQSPLVINSGMVLLVGLAGLLHRCNPHRVFLSSGVILGLGLVTMGHLGAVQGWAATDLSALLDGALAPLRNVHKFDPVLRLPLVLGLAWMVDHLLAGLRTRHTADPSGGQPGGRTFARVNTYAVVATTVVAVLGAALPVLAGRVTPAGGALGVPDYWPQAAGWLANADDSGTALLVPGSSFGTYVWGSPRDEPLQALADSPWAVRNAVPLAPPGNIRMLDAIERRLAQGQGSPGLAAYLRRAGITHLVVRNDLQRSSDIPDPVLVHQALADSPGIEPAVDFGPGIGGEAHLDGDDGRVLINGGWQNEFPALEIFEVADATGAAAGATDLPSVVGGPEDLLDLADLGVLDDQPTTLASDGQQPLDAAAPLVLTDGLRATERHFGRAHDGTSQTLTTDDPLRMGGASRDYLLPDQDRWSTRAEVSGVRRLTASSSMSDANAYGVVEQGQMPYAAVDGHPDTAWTANFQPSEAAWWQADFGSGRSVGTVVVTAGPEQRERIRLRTDAATSATVSLAPGASRSIVVDDPDAAWLRVEDVSGRVGNRLSLAEVSVPGLTVSRRLVLPSLGDRARTPDAIVLRAVRDERTGCTRVEGAVRCVPGRDVASEEPYGFRRTLSLPYAGDYEGELDVRVRPGTALQAQLQRDLPIGVSGSTQGNPDQRSSAIAAVDGDPGTTWTASLADLRPTLRLNWIDRRTIRGLSMRVAQDTAARLPEELTLVWPGGRRSVKLDEDGSVTFPPIRTDQLTLRVDEAEPVTSLDFASNAEPVPVGVSELRVTGLPYLPVALPRESVRSACGSGPSVSVNGEVVPSSVTASPADLYEGATVRAELCTDGALGLRGGENQVDVDASETFVPVSLVLRRTGVAAGALDEGTRSPAGLRRPSPVERLVSPAADARVVAVPENANPGWVASQDGRDLEPVVVDGWAQGWRVSEGGGVVRMEFRPDGAYRLGLLAGLVGLLALVLIAAVPGRRWSDGGRPAAPRPASVATLGPVAVLVGGLLAGWPGALVAAGGFAASLVLGRRLPAIAPWLLAATVLPATAAYAVRPWGSDAGWAGDLAWPGYLVVFAVTALLGSSATGGLPRFLSRWAGSSTRR